MGQKKPIILVIWGDDLCMWVINAYHRGMMGGSTLNIDHIARDGMIFMDHYVHASRTGGIIGEGERLTPYKALQAITT